MSAFPQAWVADLDNPTGPLVIRVDILNEYATGIHTVKPHVGYGRYATKMIAKTFETWEEARFELVKHADARLADAQNAVDAATALKKPEDA